MKKIYHIIYQEWFSLSMKDWFGSSKKLDTYIFTKYDTYIQHARDKKYDTWKKNHMSLLALIILLDQFPRNAYRGSQKAYVGNDYCVQLAKYGFKHFKTKYSSTELMFLLLPLQHSENIDDQKTGIKYMYNILKKSSNISIDDLKILNLTLYHHIGHFEVIQKFGRFPKRNQILDRISTNEEKVYLVSNVPKNRSY